ncbi:TFIIH complex serine/threonine-protein kinase subunit kin28 [Xylographa opegraphella]|nr:TFIIH complex serine/threonine-protein kinase subunit kin28 [Xylographa opegraphella]
MAVSPLVIQNGSADPKITAAKATALAVRTNSIATKMVDTQSEKDTGPELAEQLNEDEKQKYVKDRKVGEGTYAVVFLGHLKANPKSLVAIKKIKVMTEYQDGLSISAIREVKFLQELSHPNIIALYSVFSSKNQNLNLVLEYLPLGDLEMLIKDTEGVRYGSADIKAWMGMLGRAVWFCHENFVLHRDIKPNNLLIAADGEVKLADFGLARSFSDPYRAMSHQVITRWYRPPELLYGTRFYSGAVDVWAMGLVFAELIIRAPFLPGDSDIQQLDVICKAIGTPTEENWPGVTKLPDYVKSDIQHPVQGRDFYLGLFGTVGPAGVDLIMSTLALDPRKRSTAKQFLKHNWWANDPRPTSKEDLPKKGGGAKKMGDDLKRRGGEVEEHRGDKVARKLNFGAKR